MSDFLKKTNKSSITGDSGLAGVEATRMNLTMTVQKWASIAGWYLLPIGVPFLVYVIHGIVFSPNATDRYYKLHQEWNYISSHPFSEWPSLLTYLFFALLSGFLFSRFVGNWFYNKQAAKNEELEEDTYVEGAYLYKTLDEANEHTLELLAKEGVDEDGYFTIEHEPIEQEFTKEEKADIADLKKRLYENK